MKHEQASLQQQATPSPPEATSKHAAVLPLLRTARGHLGGIEQMIQEDRYCIDISNQLQAVIALLRKADAEILRTHMEMCVKESAGSPDFEQKLRELETVIDHLVREK